MQRVACARIAALIAAISLTTGLLPSCAPPQEGRTRAAQSVINGTNDDDSVFTNAAVGLDFQPGWCTGTLISSTYVLTAAHCVTMTPWDGVGQALVGLTPGMPAATVPINGCWRHPLAYDTGSSACTPLASPLPALNCAYDVAILRLAQPVSRALARPIPVIMAMPGGIATYANWEATLLGHGVTNFPDGGFGQPAVRMRGLIQIDTFNDMIQSLRSGPYVQGLPRAGIGSGDSGGPLLVTTTFPQMSVVGVACGTIGGPNPPVYDTWASTVNLNTGRWINNVLTNGTTSYTSGSTTGPASGWLGEGADLNGQVSPSGAPRSGDNCPNVFNPWQGDTDGDGLGDECDLCPGGLSHANTFDHDEDGDGISVECGDNCPAVASANLSDTDGDGWGDVCDLCVNVADPARSGVADQQPNCNARTEVEQGHPALGDRCDPYPCNPTENLNSAVDRITDCQPTGDPNEDACVRGSSFVQVGYAPRVGAGAAVSWTPTSTASPLVSPLWRCVCVRAGDDVQIDDPEQCLDPVTGACLRSGTYTNVTGGYGWYHAAVDAPNWATAGQGFGSVWRAPTGQLAPRFQYVAHYTRSGAAAYWRSQASAAAGVGISFWNWNWDASGEVYPASMPRAVAWGALANPPRAMFWTRAQTTSDPGSDANATGYRVARMQDSYHPTGALLEEPHAIIQPRRNAGLFWNVDLRAPPRPVGPFPFPLPLEALVGRLRPRILPLTSQSPADAQAMFFPNGSTSDPTRGIAVALVDVRQGLIVGTAATGATNASDLPVQSNLSFAIGKLDARGYPDLYAFGGRDANNALRNDLYYTTHTYSSKGAAQYAWHRVAGAAGLAARENSALVASADGARVYVLGGRAGAALYGDAWRYDLSTGRWGQVPLTATIPARYDATAVAMNDDLYLGGGVGSGGAYLGDLVKVNGITGGVMKYGNVLPLGALPDLTFDDHYQGLIYGGGYYGTTWYRDVWTVRIVGPSVTTTFVHDFGGDGLQATRYYSVVGDLAHNAFWGVPGHNVTGSNQKVWFLQDGAASTSGGGALALSAGAGGAPSGGGPTTLNPPRQTNPRGAPSAVQVRPGRPAGGVR